MWLTVANYGLPFTWGSPGTPLLSSPSSSHLTPSLCYPTTASCSPWSLSVLAPWWVLALKPRWVRLLMASWMWEWHPGCASPRRRVIVATTSTGGNPFSPDCDPVTWSRMHFSHSQVMFAFSKRMEAFLPPWVCGWWIVKGSGVQGHRFYGGILGFSSLLRNSDLLP